MNGLMNVDNEIKMNHIEVTELINRFREIEGNRKELLSKNFLTKIRNEIEIMKELNIFNELNFKPVEYKDKKGEMRPTFLMNRDGILQMCASEYGGCGNR